MLDMHFHSTFSDGRSTVDEILNEAKKKGLKYAFLTDHDRVSHYFLQESGKYGIQSCKSTEISATNLSRDFSLHITYYAKEISNALEEKLTNTVDSKIKLIQLQISRFKEFGFKINLGAFYKYCYSYGRQKENINKFDLARYLYTFDENIELVTHINNGVELELEDFYLKFLKKDGEYFSGYGVVVPDYEITVDEIKKYAQIDNALVSLAHPNFTFKSGFQEFIDNLDYYIENGGINAIEINSKATKQMVDLIVSLTKQKGLYITFGSDNHGLGRVDKKHEDFGVLNPNLSQEFISSEFEKYKHLLGLI